MLSDSEQKQLVEANLDYVRRLSRRLRTEIATDFSINDLVAYGNRGLVEAAARYDPTRGASFRTFAYYRIRGAILDGLRAEGWQQRYRRARFVEGANDLLENMAERQPATAAAVSLEDAAEDLAESLNQLTTLFIVANEEDLRIVAHGPNTDAVAQLEKREEISQVTKALTRLPEKERAMIELCYYQDNSIKDAGDALGLSRSWSSRLHARAIKLLGQALKNVQAGFA